MKKEKQEGGQRINGNYKKSYPGKPLVTVVTVVRNAASQIAKTIESVINQTYDNIEYIIIDGASTDGTLDIIETYENRIDYWTGEKDKGVYYGMNKAIDLARGEWINFMNAGDWFYKPEVIKSLFENSLFPEDTDLLYGDYFFLYSDTGQMVPLTANPLDTLWKEMAFSHQALFTRREWIAQQKFSHKYKSASDYHFILKSYKEKKNFFHVNEFICVYADGGMSINRQLRSMIERWKIARKYGQAPKKEIDKFHIRDIYDHLPSIINRMIRGVKNE
jgi:glycosyltransferase involved in cell wall biosynthesis